MKTIARERELGIRGGTPEGRSGDARKDQPRKQPRSERTLK